MILRFVDTDGHRISFDTQMETWNDQPAPMPFIDISPEGLAKIAGELNFSMFSYSTDLRHRPDEVPDDEDEIPLF